MQSPVPVDEERTVAPPLWRNRDYMLLWSGQTVSVIGSQISQLAFPLLVLSLTRSPAQAGFATGLRMIPYLGLSLVAGALVDRWNRKRLMILCDAGRAIVLGSVPLAIATGHISMAQLYLVSLIEGTLFVFFSIANTASLPQVVGKAQLTAASAQNETSYQASSLVGPLTGGALFGLSRALPFLADAVSYTASVISLLYIRVPFQEQREAPRANLTTEIRAGLAWLWKQPLVRMFAFLASILWIMFGSVPLVVILLARGQHLGAGTIGEIFSIGAVGGLLGAAAAAKLQQRVGFSGIVLVAPWLMALLYPLYTLAPNAIVLGLITAGLFFVFPVYNVVQYSYRLALIPDELQGRVNSAFRLIAFAGQPLGTSLAGVLIQSMGVRHAILVLLASPVAMGLAALLSPHVRHAPDLHEVVNGQR